MQRWLIYSDIEAEKTFLRIKPGGEGEYYLSCIRNGEKNITNEWEESSQEPYGLGACRAAKDLVCRKNGKIVKPGHAEWSLPEGDSQALADHTQIV